MNDSGSLGNQIRRYWAVIIRRKYAAILVGLGVLSVFTWGSFFMRKTYEATSTVFVERSALINPLIQGVGIQGSIDETLRNLRSTITSRNFVEKVLGKMDLDMSMKNTVQYEKVVDEVIKGVTVSVKGGNQTDLFSISFRGGDPTMVKDLVNSLVSQYIEENEGQKRSDAYEAYEFIQSQLVEYKTRLEQSDAMTRAFRERNPGMLPQSEVVLLGKAEGFQTARTDAEIRLKELSRRRESLQKQLSGEKELTVAFVTREGSPQARLNHLQSELLLLMTKYTSSHPDVLRVKNEIDELSRQMKETKDHTAAGAGTETSTINPIYQQLREELSKTDAEIESLRGRVAELSRRQQETQSALGKMPKEQEEWTKIQRDRDVYQKIYNDLLVKLENARVTKDLELAGKASTLRVVDPAIFPQFPVKPDRVKMILLGVLLGIAAGIGAAFGLEQADHSFKDEDSVETSLKVRVLASIPRIVTDLEEVVVKKRDRKVFAFAGGYLCVVGAVLIAEMLNRYVGIKVIPF